MSMWLFQRLINCFSMTFSGGYSLMSMWLFPVTVSGGYSLISMWLFQRLINCFSMAFSGGYSLMSMWPFPEANQLLKHGFFWRLFTHVNVAFPEANQLFQCGFFWRLFTHVNVAFPQRLFSHLIKAISISSQCMSCCVPESI